MNHQRNPRQIRERRRDRIARSVIIALIKTGIGNADPYYEEAARRAVMITDRMLAEMDKRKR